VHYHPEYVMTLQVQKENHTGSDRNAGVTADPTAGRTRQDRTAEVGVRDPSVCAESA